MSSEVAFLEIRVGAQGATEARNRLKELTEQSERAEKAAQKLAAETEKAEARKAAAVAAAAAKADKLATDAAIREGREAQRRADEVARFLQRQEAAEARRAAAVEKAAARESAAREKAEARQAEMELAAAARIEAAAARKTSIVQAAAQRQELARQNASQRELESVRRSLQTEEEALRESYLRRRRIIEANTTGSQRQMMLAGIDHQYGQQKQQLSAGPVVNVKEAESAADGIKRLALQYIGLQTAISGVRKLIEVNREFDKLNAGLITATGSADGASQAFNALEDFASKTPFSLRETTGGFVKLVNYGLMPSERAMRSYGNTASALGKDLGMMIEAVADAQTGEFERLKEFGVKAKQEGDKVTLTFRGVSTTINKNSKEIQEYLIALGETNFGDSMANRMDTLDGKLSNLGDAWDKLFREVGNSAVGDLIKDFADTGIVAIEGLIGVMQGPAVSAAVTGLRTFFIQLAGDVDKAIGYITFDKERVRNADATVAALLREMRIEQQSAENTREFTKALRENEKAAKDRLAQFERAGDTSGLASFNQSMADANAKFSEQQEKKREQDAKARAQRDKTEYQQLVEKLSSEEEAIGRSFAKRQQLIDKMSKRAGAEQTTKLTYANAQMYETEMANTKAAKLREAQEKEVKDLEESLRSKEEIARAAYEKQVAMVTKNVDDEIRAEALRTDLLQKEIDRRIAVEAEKERATADKRNRKEALFSPYQNEVEQIRQNERRKLEEYQKARDEDLISAEEHAMLKAKLYHKTEGDLVALDMRNKEAIAGNSAALFGNLAQLSKNMGGEQSSTYKGLFAMSKAFSIAQATMSIATGTAKALELGWPAGIAAGLAVAAQGAGLLATITSSNYSGAYDQGGIIPAGRVGLVGERGPELVRGPAVVTGRQQTAQIMGGQAQGGASQPQAITLINAPDTRGAYQFARSAQGDQVFVNGIRKNATVIRQLLAAGG